MLICSSCSSIYRFSIDVQEPAPVTLPVAAQNVLILNNTVVQPNDYGIERIYEGQPIRSDYPLSMDSMVWSAIDEIAAVLSESNFFNKVAIYGKRKPLRTDSDWLSLTYLSPKQQYDFYDTENFDALLVIEQLLFSIKEDVKKIKTEDSYSDIAATVNLRGDGIIICSMYTYEKEKPLITVRFSDSLYSKSLSDNDSLILFKAFPEYFLNELSFVLGNKAANCFVPSWKTEERILFVSYNPRMQEAVGYAADRQWTNAESTWVTELEKKTKPVDKAKIAFNLAVTNEMRDKFEPALEWAQKAKEYLKDADKDKNSQEIELTDKYISELERRIQNNQLLDLQWGKE